MEGTNTPTNYIQHYKFDGDYYDYFTPDKFMLEEIRRRYQEFHNLGRFKVTDAILEIGSGGGFAQEILKRVQSNYFPLDIPVRNLKIIKGKCSLPVFPVASDAHNLPFKERSFDSVIMAEVLEHLSSPEIVLSEVRRILKDQGTLLVSVPYKEKITYQICIHCNKPTPTHSHLHSFDTENLSQLMKTTGFRTVKVSKICNKIPSRLHFNIFFQNVPFRIWKIFDNFFTLLVDKPTSLIIVGKKI